MQIESLLAADDPVRTYETRVPVTELPNFKSPRQPLSWGLLAACATTGAAVTGKFATLPDAKSFALCSIPASETTLQLFVPLEDPCRRNDFAIICATRRR